jgi:hypothetical protein
MTTNTSALIRAGLIPYITLWSAERTPSPRVVVRPRGDSIAFPDETVSDRDRRGVLWQPERLAPGQGSPMFSKIHGLRQRRAMRRLLCQVCAGPADRDERGVLWLLPDHRQDWPGWPEQAAETAPPVCLPCARKSVRLCPRLRRAHAAVRVRDPELYGVYGIVHRQVPGGPAVQRIGVETVRFGDPRVRWTVANHLVRRLQGRTIVDLDQEPQSPVTTSPAA